MLGWSLVRTERLRELEKATAALQRFQRGENAPHLGKQKEGVNAKADQAEA